MKKILLVFLFTMFTKYLCCQSNDTLEIKKVLEKESSTWRSGDIKGHASCWQIQPYSRILISTGDSTVLDIPPSIMINPPSAILGKGGSSKNTNYKISITGTAAWVSHDEESISAEGKKNYSYEFRMLEKIKGNWKLVGQSIHIYKAK